MRLDHAIEKFITSRSTSGYSTNTLRNNRSQLTQFAAHLPNVEVAQLTADDMEEAFRATSQTRAPGTMAQVLATVNIFCKWCRTRSITPPTWNPTASIRSPKVQRKERMRVPVTDFPRLIEAGEDRRDRAVITTALTLMLRQSEIATIRIGDVNLTDGEVVVTIHKTNQSDTMPIPVELDRELRSWLTFYTDHVGELTDDMLLFPARQIIDNSRSSVGTYQAGQWTYLYRPRAQIRHMEDIATRALKACGYTLGKGEGMHTLRRSAARALFDRLVADGYDGALRMVQAMLHHSSSVTTERYIGLTLDRKRRDDLIRGAVMYPVAEVVDIGRLRHG